MPVNQLFCLKWWWVPVFVLTMFAQNPKPSKLGCYHFFIIIVSGVRLSPLGTVATIGLLYQPQMMDDGDCGEIGGMKIGRGNRSTLRKPAPAPFCPPQIPHGQSQARTRATAVGSQRLTT
jgi:hypothetical protein